MLAVVLGLLAVAAAGGLAWTLRAAAPPWLIGVLGVLAAFGLLSSFAWIAGFVSFGSDPQQRAFFDGLMDSLSEACVVTDARGRAVYANAQFIKLVSGAGISRLVGVENLYAGYPDASETGLSPGAGGARGSIAAGGVQACRRLGCGRGANRSAGVDQGFGRADNL